jgi:hypothetical protein
LKYENQTQNKLHEYEQILFKNRVGIFWTNIYYFLAFKKQEKWGK